MLLYFAAIFGYIAVWVLCVFIGALLDADVEFEDASFYWWTAVFWPVTLPAVLLILLCGVGVSAFNKISTRFKLSNIDNYPKSFVRWAGELGVRLRNRKNSLRQLLKKGKRHEKRRLVINFHAAILCRDGSVSFSWR